MKILVIQGHNINSRYIDDLNQIMRLNEVTDLILTDINSTKPDEWAYNFVEQKKHQEFITEYPNLKLNFGSNINKERSLALLTKNKQTDYQIFKSQIKKQQDEVGELNLNVELQNEEKQEVGVIQKKISISNSPIQDLDVEEIIQKKRRLSQENLIQNVVEPSKNNNKKKQEKQLVKQNGGELTNKAPTIKIKKQSKYEKQQADFQYNIKVPQVDDMNNKHYILSFKQPITDEKNSDNKDELKLMFLQAPQYNSDKESQSDFLQKISKIPLEFINEQDVIILELNRPLFPRKQDFCENDDQRIDDYYNLKEEEYDEKNYKTRSKGFFEFSHCIKFIKMIQTAGFKMEENDNLEKKEYFNRKIILKCDFDENFEVAAKTFYVFHKNEKNLRINSELIEIKQNGFPFKILRETTVGGCTDKQYIINIDWKGKQFSKLCEQDTKVNCD